MFNRKVSRRSNRPSLAPAVIEAMAPRQMLSTTLLSVGTDGNAAGAEPLFSPPVLVSPDSRFVLFFSNATNLVSGVTDTNNAADLFLRDTQSNTTTIITVNTSGTATGNSPLSAAIFSPDSRFLLTRTTSANIVAGVGDTNNAPDLFLRDLLTGTVKAITRNPVTGTTGNNGASATDAVGFSEDSTRVLYTSPSDDLVTVGSDSGTSDVFLYDIARSTNTLVSGNTAGNGHAPSTSAGTPALSQDGRYVAFLSNAGDLAAGVTDTNAAADLYIRDLITGTTRLVTRTPAGTASSVGSAAVFRFTSKNELVFQSGGDVSTGVAADATVTQIYLYQPSLDTTIALSVAGGTTSLGNQSSALLAVSEDGNSVAFSSSSSNLTPESDSDDKQDLYVHNIVTGVTTYVTKNTTTSTSYATPTYSPDSSLLMFNSPGAGVVDGIEDTNEVQDLFLLDLATLKKTAVTLNTTKLATSDSVNFSIDEAGFSPDSKYIKFVSDANNLVTDFGLSRADLYIYEIATQVIRPVTVSPLNGSAGYESGAADAVFSADSRLLVFVIDLQTQFAGGNDFNFGTDVFAYDVATGVRTLLSVNAAGDSGNFPITNSSLVLAPTGDRILYLSNASDYVLTTGAGDSGQTSDLFLTTLPGVVVNGGTPEISVAGLAGEIVDGSATPSTTAGTDFGSTFLGVPAERTFTVTNGGSGTLQILGVTLPAGFTLLEPLNASIAAGGSDSFTVRFLPTAVGGQTGDVVVTSNDADEGTYSFVVTARGALAPASNAKAALTGNGQAIASGSTTPTTNSGADFGQTPRNTAVQKSFTVTNSGTDLLTLSNLSLGGFGFSVIEGLSATLAPGASDTFTLQFVSNLNSVLTSTVTFATNDAAAPIYSFAVRATSGQVSPPPPTSGAPDLVIEGGVTGVKAGSFVAGAKGGKASVKVFNRGDTIATGNLGVSFYLSTDATFDSTDILASTVTKKANLKVGKSLTVTSAFNYPTVTTGGAYFVLAVADSASTFTELNETNNNAASGVPITVAPPFIDLAPSELLPKGGFVPNKNVSATLNLLNPGNVAAKGTVTAELFIALNANTDAAISLGTTTLNLNVAAGKTKKITLKGALGTLTPGTYSLFATVDKTNALAESNETNNNVFSNASITVS